jgi:hypothetical protein
MVTYLVFIACIGSQCHLVGIKPAFPSVEACDHQAMPTVLKWMSRHPMYTSFREITCGPEPADEGTDL